MAPLRLGGPPSATSSRQTFYFRSLFFFLEPQFNPAHGGTQGLTRDLRQKLLDGPLVVVLLLDPVLVLGGFMGFDLRGDGNRGSTSNCSPP